MSDCAQPVRTTSDVFPVLTHAARRRLALSVHVRRFIESVPSPQVPFVGLTSLGVSCSVAPRACGVAARRLQ
jgi:hypothetical protein